MQVVPPASSPLYIGVFQAWFIIGPAVGYILGIELLVVVLVDIRCYNEHS